MLDDQTEILTWMEKVEQIVSTDIFKRCVCTVRKVL